jgi:hypothetical protein
MVARFEKAVAERHIDAVIISSQGGGFAESLRIAETVQARGMDVTVRELCLGTCAQYILVAGRHRHIEDEALVWFSVSTTGFSALLESLGDNVPPDFKPPGSWLDVSARERRLYEKAGVAASLLEDPQLALQPQCIVFRRREAAADGGTMTQQYIAWIPTRQYLDSAGLAFEGFWPESRKQVERIAGRLIKPQGKDKPARRIRFGDEDHLRRRGQPAYSLKRLEACTLEQEARR